MVRKSKQGMKKSPPAGRGRGSQKPRPPGVVPITKFFPRSPKSTSSITEAAGSSSHSSTQLSPPLRELPKSPLSDASNQSLSESTTGQRMSTQPLKVSSKKIKLGDVRVVLRKSPIKRENKVGACAGGGAECQQHKSQTETPQSNVITISDSPADLSSSLSIDVELTAPEPKRLCLIDLTESPPIVVDMQQKSNTQSLGKAVCGESSDTNEGMKDSMPTTSSTTPNTSYTIKKALFPDCDLQCNSTTLKDDVASPSPGSQKNDKDKIQDDSSSSKEAIQTPILPTGEEVIQPLTTKEEMITQPLHHPTTTGEETTQPLHPPTTTGEMAARPLNHPTFGEQTTQVVNTAPAAREETTQVLNAPRAGEMATQALKAPTTGEETLTRGTIQPLNHPTTGEDPITGGESSQPVNPPATKRETIGYLSHLTEEGDIQPQTLNRSEPMDLPALTKASANSTQKSSSTADSATVVRSERVPTTLDDHSQALNDLESVLCQRGASYFQGDSCAVKLFSVTQNSVLDNLLDFNSRVQSRKLASIVQYLRIATTQVTMPKAQSLTELWELITDPITSSNAGNFAVLKEIVRWFHQLLLLHPPGQHHTVDQQYALFFNSLSSSTSVAVFGLWEHIMDLLSGSEYCIQFLSILVDILLADYWAFLDSHRKTPPLFVGILWQSCEHTHLTVPIRKLLEMITLLLLDYDRSKMESLKLGNLMVLIYLGSTRCRDLTTEMLLVAQKLPIDKLLLFFSHVRPLSLSIHLAENVPQLKEMIARFAGLFCPRNSGAFRKLFKPSQVNCFTSLLSSGYVNQVVCVNNEEETMECTPSVQPQSQPSQNVSDLNAIQGVQQARYPVAETSQLTKEPGLQPKFNSCANMQIRQSSTTIFSSQELGGTVKKVIPSIVHANRRQQANELFEVKGKDHTSTSRVMVQVVYQCENCTNGTCPRCIQARSIPINNCKK